MDSVVDHTQSLSSQSTNSSGYIHISKWIHDTLDNEKNKAGWGTRKGCYFTQGSQGRSHWGSIRAETWRSNHIESGQEVSHVEVTTNTKVLRWEPICSWEKSKGVRAAGTEWARGRWQEMRSDREQDQSIWLWATIRTLNFSQKLKIISSLKTQNK